MKRFFSALLSSIFLVCALATNNALAQTVAASSVEATITKINSDKSIEVNEPNIGEGITPTLSAEVKNKIGRELLLSQGDNVTLKNGENNQVTSIVVNTKNNIPRLERTLCLIAGAGVLFFSTILLLGWAGLGCLSGISKLILGEDNRYSNSKFQIALWFFTVISTYLAVVFLRAYENAGILINIPQNLLLLSGMSALTFGGAKAITASNSDPTATKAASEANTAKIAADAAEAAKATTDTQNEAAIKIATDNANTAKDKLDEATKKADEARKKANEKKLHKIYNPGTPSFLKDLLQDDNGKVDFGDFQMVMVTFLAVGVYLFQIYNFMDHIDYLKEVTLPDADTTILSVFGLGQGAYLAKKAAGSGTS